MSYLGQVELKSSEIRRIDVTSSTSATHTLTWTPPSEQSLIITINGIKQQNNYSISGTTLTLDTALTATDEMEVVGILDIGEAVVPPDDSITNAMVKSDAAIDATKVADGSVTSTEFQYINSLSSNAQTQITNTVTVANAALPKSGGTMSGATVFADQLSSRFIAKDYAETVYAGGNTSTSVTLDETDGNVQTFTMTGNCTFTMPSGSGLQAGTSITLILTQDGTGSRTGAFTSVKWAGGTAPTLTTTATTGIDVITFYTFNGGASPVWYGFAAGLDMQ